MAAVAVTAPTEPRRRDRPAGSGFDWGQPFVYLVALIAVLISVVPVAYVWIGGFRRTADINANPAGWPDPWTLDSYLRVLGSSRFWGSVFSSSVVGIGTTAGVVLLGVMAAFVIARYDFRGRGALYSLFAAGLMFPLTVAALPLTILLRDIGLQGSFLGVIIPQVAFALPTTVIILVPFLRAIPAELEEAAAIDGTSRIGFFWRIMLPLSVPGLVTVGVLAFVGSWNAYLLPLLVMAAGGMPQDLWTLPLGVQQFSTQYSADTGAVLAYTSLAMLPALAFFLFAEKRIVGGLTGAVKG
ncbi:carbohydrate ABC transporter permease [Microbacterium saccharophilum]|uniref:Carbohydrate ABC transporter permease n=1 Tax=Microbacterium saccharophilum TaxID=1213358 RepID=A0A5C8I718_9MICO|nr:MULTISPECIES: carbohydrate ABC transporter permease [Microbacterium]TXK15296.1 carbohydrate ABC transporter permease [Microbacterium saccharophilum]GEP46996.1 sugar ABC transporter permease [Microbacterium saccharophilum]SFI58100.1 raffinose/stachyose/melibiose transport system permease protein [Microbacterium saccharophilum]